MSQSEQKIVQYLNEAHASEVALVSVLQSQIAISPPGSYRQGVETHLEETREHARRLRERLEELGHAGNPLQAFVGFGEAVIGEMLALSKAPFDLWRGGSVAEKVLKDAKDACATEALEIATYAALECLAEQVADGQTARLAASIRRDEERMLQRILGEIPKLTDAVAEAEIGHRPASELTDHGRPGAGREGARQSRRPARATGTTRGNKTARTGRTPRTSKTARATRPARNATAASADGTARSGRTGRAGTAPRQTRPRASGATGQSPARPRSRQVEAQANQAARSRDDLPIQRYGSLSTEEIVNALPQLSQGDLAKIHEHERGAENRDAVLTRIGQLRSEEPWPGYDGLTVAEIESVLDEGDLQRAQAVAAYERAHKNRPEVMRSALIPARFLVSSATR